MMDMEAMDDTNSGILDLAVSVSVKIIIPINLLPCEKIGI